ncbi:MAG: ribosome maturation factor RimM [Acidobacteriota bacterium]
MAFPRRIAAPEPQRHGAPESAPLEAAGGGAHSSAEARVEAVPPTPKWILLARLIRPHGRRGELVAEILTDFPERFHERKRLMLIPPERTGTRPREMDLENFWFLRSRIVMKFVGVDSINDAEALRGFEVAIPFAERAPLEAGSVYLSDLIGCRVVDLNRRAAEVGTVVDVDRESSNTELLVLRPADPGSRELLLIPYVREYLVRVDTEHRRLEMRLPEGLLEINAPMTEEEKQEARNR